MTTVTIICQRAALLTARLMFLFVASSIEHLGALTLCSGRFNRAHSPISPRISQARFAVDFHHKLFKLRNQRIQMVEADVFKHQFTCTFPAHFDFYARTDLLRQLFLQAQDVAIRLCC